MSGKMATTNRLLLLTVNSFQAHNDENFYPLQGWNKSTLTHFKLRELKDFLENMCGFSICIFIELDTVVWYKCLLSNRLD